MLGTMVEVAGEIVGTWQRPTTGKLVIDVAPWRALKAAEKREIEHAAARFAAFVGRALADLRFASRR